MIDAARIPAGFAVAFESGTASLIADVRSAEGLLALGLHEPAGWEARLDRVRFESEEFSELRRFWDAARTAASAALVRPAP